MVSLQEAGRQNNSRNWESRKLKLEVGTENPKEKAIL
jgi:hypothetical protein